MSFQHFRAQRSQNKGQGWLKHIGKFGFPIKILLKFYQMFVVWYDLVYFSIVAYKEMWFSLFAFVFPLQKKSLIYDVAVVSGTVLSYRIINYYLTDRSSDQLKELEAGWLSDSPAVIRLLFVSIFCRRSERKQQRRSRTVVTQRFIISVTSPTRLRSTKQSR